VSETAEAFDASALERRYAILDQLPESLFQAAATHLHGALLERVQGLLQWNEALLQGSAPELNGLRWPAPEMAEPLRKELLALRLPHFCRGEKALTESLLLQILEVVGKGESSLGAWEAHHLARLLEQERERRRLEAARAAKEAQKARKARAQPRPEASSEFSNRPRMTESQSKDARGGEGGTGVGGEGAADGEGAGGPSAPAEVEPDARTLAALRAEAARLARQQAAEQLVEQVRAAWQERARIWAELEEVFGELSELLGRGWDLARGLLRTQGWVEIARLRALLEKLPALRELIQALGRMRSSEDPTVPPVLETLLGPVRRVAEELQRIHTPLARSETRGIERSGDIQRMLPAECVLLGHPTLRLLWHARRAERTLMTYRVEGVDVERVLGEREEQEAQSRQKPADGRGPILVCLDTSGSMEGLPELVAKALVLESMRVALAEKRACYLYAFSGPGDVQEHELSLTEEGLARLMAVLTMSFHGGTDVSAPLSRAVARLGEEGWKRADLLLVSDGEFDVAANTRELVARARAQRGLRSHGIHIGAGNTSAMAAICSPVHRFTDWQVLLGTK
jgi:uncharacterized protein with von Willebrand factor type A (vWA) domain